ncbi:MAG TPA: cytochrome c3 family protein [Pyrinomonadaceae bacterium]|nr:cytochrome c3 family protein [Pyrinomonadaceae bacterium]
MTSRSPQPQRKRSNTVWLLSLCILTLFCISVVSKSKGRSGNPGDHDWSQTFLIIPKPQGPNTDYSIFKHNSQKHASLECNSCHQRSDNSATPRWPGHKACTGCHVGQFVTPAAPMCLICHADVNSSNPPLKNFPTAFNESFNVKFDHAQHSNGGARPQNGCAACHGRQGRAGAALSIPVSISAHNQCYSCHTPGSRSGSGHDLASCGICHDQRGFSRTPTSARSFRYAFSHAKHSRVGCNDCHRVTAGAAQMRQVSSPAPSEHFETARGSSCSTCHNGKRSFGGDLSFKDCKRCHTGSTFRMPM